MLIVYAKTCTTFPVSLTQNDTAKGRAKAASVSYLLNFSQTDRFGFGPLLDLCVMTRLVYAVGQSAWLLP